MTKTNYSFLEENFYFLWKNYYPDIILVREHKIIKSRRFLFDFAHLETNIAIEIQGGNYSKGRRAHSTATGLNRDYEKFNLAQLSNWEIYQLDTKMVNKDWVIKIGDRILYKLACWEIVDNSLDTSK